MDEGRPTRDLSKHQITLLQLLAEGKTEDEVARSLGLGPNAVAAYLQDLYRKVGTKTRTHAVAVAICEGFVRLEETDI